VCLHFSQLVLNKIREEEERRRREKKKKKKREEEEEEKGKNKKLGFSEVFPVAQDGPIRSDPQLIESPHFELSFFEVSPLSTFPL